MNRIAMLCMAMSAVSAWAHTIILHDGSSYSGRGTSANAGAITFTNQKGRPVSVPFAGPAVIGDVKWTLVERQAVD